LAVKGLKEAIGCKMVYRVSGKERAPFLIELLAGITLKIQLKVVLTQKV